MILLIFTLAIFTHAGGTEGGIFDSPDQSYSSGCMGSLKVYQESSDHYIITETSKKLSQKVPRNSLIRVEGNCCWKVYGGKNFKGSVSTLVSRIQLDHDRCWSSDDSGSCGRGEKLQDVHQ